MRSGVVTVALETPMRLGDWLRQYWFDLVTLFLASIAVARCWWTYFDLHDRRLWLPIAAATLVGITRRIGAARHAQQRPITFCSDRRQDLLAAIALAVGPWPIIPTFAFRPIGVVWTAPAGPALALAIVGIVIAATAMRAIGSRTIQSLWRERVAIRELTGVPARHVASLFVVPGQHLGGAEFTPAVALLD